MRYRNFHSWDVSPSDAVRIQKDLQEQIVLEKSLENFSRIAGVDVSFSKEKDKATCGVIIFSFPELSVIERRVETTEIKFPYIPGLLAFREGPSVLSAFDKLETEPDLIMFDAQGIAHPRGIGLASHMGLILGKPSIGCAKTRLCGEYEEPEEKQGSFSYLKKEGKIIGAVLRTKEKIKPVFVSTGHEIDLEICIRTVLECCRGYRLPEPTRQAHLLVAGKVTPETRMGLF